MAFAPNQPSSGDVDIRDIGNFPIGRETSKIFGRIDCQGLPERLLYAYNFDINVARRAYQHKAVLRPSGRRRRTHLGRSSGLLRPHASEHEMIESLLAIRQNCPKVGSHVIL